MVQCTEGIVILLCAFHSDMEASWRKKHNTKPTAQVRSTLTVALADLCAICWQIEQSQFSLIILMLLGITMVVCLILNGVFRWQSLKVINLSKGVHSSTNQLVLLSKETHVVIENIVCSTEQSTCWDLQILLLVAATPYLLNEALIKISEASDVTHFLLAHSSVAQLPFESSLLITCWHLRTHTKSWGCILTILITFHIVQDLEVLLFIIFIYLFFWYSCFLGGSWNWLFSCMLVSVSGAMAQGFQTMIFTVDIS